MRLFENIVVALRVTIPDLYPLRTDKLFFKDLVISEKLTQSLERIVNGFLEQTQRPGQDLDLI